MNDADVVVPAFESTFLQGSLSADAKLERARTELLDLTARNRLLNIPRSSTTARTIDVVDEKTSEVFRLMVSESRPFTFLPGKEANKAGLDKTGHAEDSDEIGDLAQPENNGVDERGVLHRHADTKLQTRLTSKGLQKRLLDMYLDARTLEEEQGVNILFLALGTLKWLDPLNAKNVRHAPLILIPVSLERGNAAEQFKLKWRQEEHSSNLSLEAFLERVHHLKMPAYEAGDEFDPLAYIEAVRDAVKSKEGWVVDGDDIVLGFFSFSKFLMYRDLDPATWPEGGLTTQPLMRGLLSDGFAFEESTIPEDANLDEHIAPADLLHIVDCDSSQTLAVHDVRAGRNLVIQGPPGTGKSQTIANVIASAIADGKTVLFVAEKMAALEVVKRRLDQAGVGDACIELHSNKANKKMFLDELRRTSELGSPKGDTATTLNHRLLAARNELNAHSARLHEPHSAARLTPYQVIGELSRLRQDNVKPVDIRLQQPESWSPDELQQRLAVVEELAQRIVDIGEPQDHPWRGVALKVILPNDVERLVARITALRACCQELAAQQADLALSLDTLAPAVLRDMDYLTELARAVAAAPNLSAASLRSPAWGSAGRELAALVDDGLRLQRVMAELAGEIKPEAWNTDVQALREQLAGLPAHADALAFERYDALQTLLAKLDGEVALLSRLLGVDTASQMARQMVSYGEINRMVQTAQKVASAPDVSADVFVSTVWDEGVEQAADLAQAVAALEGLQARLEGKVSSGAWQLDLVPARQVLAAHGESLLRFVNGEWRAASKQVKGVLRNPEAPLPEQLEILDELAEGRKLIERIASQDTFGSGAFGADWRGEQTRSAPLLALVEWMRSLRGLGAQPRMIASTLPDRPEMSGRAALVAGLLQEIRPLLDTMWFSGWKDETAFRDWTSVEAAPLQRMTEQVARLVLCQAGCASVMLNVPPGLADKIARLDLLIATQALRTRLEAAGELARSAFGAAWQGAQSDWNHLRSSALWLAEHQQLRQMVARHDDRAAPLRRALEIDATQRQLLAGLDALYGELCTNSEKLFQVPAIADLPAFALLGRMGLWIEFAEELSTWVTYRERCARARQLGIGEIVTQLEAGVLAPAQAMCTFTMAYFEALFADQVRSDEALAHFDGHLHGRLAASFAQMDRQRITASSLEVVRAHHRRIPQGGGAIGPLGVLRGEMAKRKGHMPIRRLMQRAAPAIQALKPVFMMSPLSVAQFLPAGQLSFDLLVMDEASQIQPVDALGAIARSRQVVVVGDERQLPPTKFFSKMTSAEPDDDGDDDTQVSDIESILGLFTARGLPQRMLRWHYRSRHQSLIAVSNSQFYDNKLFIVPSPYTQEAGMGLQFHHIANGVFDSGNTGTNAEEAKVIAEAIIHHARTAPGHSLGVATFSVKQRRAIQDALELLRRQHPDAEPFFQQHPSEPFFIKNLENVQGDERDVIFISVGYGRNQLGAMAMRFGPLSAEGGERRLNVLISRAKRRCEVFASITDEDIDLERAKGRGVAAFKLFLHFARTGKLGLARVSGREADSPFEVQVADAVKACGYEVHPQVGIAGFFIDLGIADAEHPGRYLLGIECDGESYHRSRSARDRDRLRQAVLEDHGWIIHRIWSLDWYQRPNNELQRLILAIDAAKVELAARAELHGRQERRPGVSVVTVEREDHAEIGLERQGSKRPAAYVEATSVKPAYADELHDMPVAALSELVRQIVAVEGPVHADEVVVRLRTAWGLKRTGARIQAAVERAIDAAIRFDGMLMTERFLSLPDTVIAIRDRGAVVSDTLRKPDMLPPQEIDVAILGALQKNYGAGLVEIAQYVARLFGFKATSPQLRETIRLRLDDLLLRGLLQKNGEVFALRQQEST
ncbi:DUF3320 domain-containing protein [Janthinobacterium psychrotolerans]|uniref:AAA domain-containing protein n=1 Tax=Janthinobacterium psychrotolerans TaxID=1747903 RepID=A0A1A7BT50_9BURK|nr:DUF3320 domain-containing protein [Janthinobacterium psychrotolerans]OBV36702.1 AAA domain-containing protein [Janthinobacterium psychrotolerans]